ncbi:MAG TPA: threonylcarbamoyl-AMP synthase [Hyphomonadaceae bacterium]|nr:threonylcarbamoyl-AMP synthase [Hyphomonadaceae bacterium]
MGDSLARAIDLLRAGQLVVAPTETVYGLAADAGNPQAIAQIFALKARPAFNPLIAHVASLAMAQDIAYLGPIELRLAARFWPGPLTIVADRRQPDLPCDLACAGLASVALRMPDHPIMLALIEGLARPIAAPSANRSGRISPTLPAHVTAEFGAETPFLLDGGACRIGLESTIIRVAADDVVHILRPGFVTAEMLEAVSHCPVRPPAPSDDITAPGQLLAHYAPAAPVRLNRHDPSPGDILIGFGPHSRAAPEWNLSPAGDLAQAAATLYAFLRAADAIGPSAIVIEPIPDHGLGLAINDRLRRAAHRD